MHTGAVTLIALFSAAAVLTVAAARPRLRQYVLAKVGQAVPPANFAGR